MYSRIIRISGDKSFFLFGPRGTGKTTWVKQAFPQAVYIDLLEAEVFNDLLANPGRLKDFIPPRFNDWVIIDEIQKVPQLLDEVHRLIEKEGVKFILTGSSPRKLRRGGYNLLAGRALTNLFYLLTVIELGEDFDLKHSLTYGHLPCIYTEKEPGRYLESYVRTYLEEEIQQEGLTKNLSAFARFLETASFSQGGVLNISEVARECAVQRKVVEEYFNILEDLLLGYRISCFNKKAKRRMAAHTKFYFFDTGVYRTLRPSGPLDAPEEIEGIALKTLFFQEVLALNNLLHLGYKIYYWRTSTGLEVDFVLYGEKGLIAFEIKRKQRLTRQDISGIKAFIKDYPQAQVYILYGGTKRMYYEDKIEVLPVEEAFRNLKDILITPPA